MILVYLVEVSPGTIVRSTFSLKESQQQLAVFLRMGYRLARVLKLEVDARLMLGQDVFLCDGF